MNPEMQVKLLESKLKNMSLGLPVSVDSTNVHYAKNKYDKMVAECENLLQALDDLRAAEDQKDVGAYIAAWG